MLNKAAELMKQSRYIVALTGAGMSTESGLPDFRSNGGLWAGKKPEEIAHITAVGSEAFKTFYSMRMKDLAAHQPNKGHRILAEWENGNIVKAIVTQNVDGYHQQAGSKRVIEMHGHLRSLYCDECYREYSVDKYMKNHDDCCETPGCNGTVRPPIILFGEALPEGAWEQATEEISKADLVLVVGTSLNVFPVNTLVEAAKQSGAHIILMTKSDTPYDYLADVRIHESIGETLTELDRLLTNKKE
ncbi:NAD-dependent deacylase [Bacillus sp. AGMB 02131]|uniref:protein acetyllysine N-acetyltransferase n=1 Tax=Peribacillus faecalis TaxID=2772559 RepID=A0A927CV97_9BACI|nr:NAD-dependent deacylase [Peribacillus faecalis]MBD3108452.1 NAD-dependent deacylase [Peribacillus faecalis]